MQTLSGRREEVAEKRLRGLALQRSGNSDGLPEMRIFVLSTFNADLLNPFLAEALSRIGVYAHVESGKFGQMAQEVLDPDSPLYAENPNAVLIVPAAEDTLAPLFSNPSDFSTEEAAAFVENSLDELRGLLRRIAERLPATTCYVAAMGPVHAPMEHILDPRSSVRGQAAVELFSSGVRLLAEPESRIVVIDWDWHIRGTGTLAYTDERLWYLARMRLNQEGLAALADLVSHAIGAHSGKARKVAVVDFDNTLWGGIVGEAGLAGIQLGDEGIGFAYQDFQRELLKLHRAGVVLAGCSKNNSEDAMEVFDRHPGMILKREHFAALRINWTDKGTNLLEIAEELNLGADSIVFLDDNPAEREWIRATLPQVAVPELPADPTERPSFLRNSRLFWRTSLTEADRNRAGSYKAQGLRRELQSTAGNIHEYLESLEQEITFESLDPGAIGRAAQLCQRTNQFNLTTRRYSAAELEAMGKQPSMRIYTLKLDDRFGSSGIVGLAILKQQAGDAEIDTFLLSCRALGRKVEDAFLALLAGEARQDGARRLIGEYVPTAKNRQTGNFYTARGFQQHGDNRFVLDLTSSAPPAPAEIAVKKTTTCANV